MKCPIMSSAQYSTDCVKSYCTFYDKDDCLIVKGLKSYIVKNEAEINSLISSLDSKNLLNMLITNRKDEDPWELNIGM